MYSKRIHVGFFAARPSEERTLGKELAVAIHHAEADFDALQSRHVKPDGRRGVLLCGRPS